MAPDPVVLAGLTVIRTARGLALLVILAVLSFPTDAHAYIDPGAGSLIYQTVLAVLLGLGFFLRSTREKIARLVKSLFVRRGSREDTSPADPR
jgi:hypothetical protein